MSSIFRIPQLDAAGNPIPGTTPPPPPPDTRTRNQIKYDDNKEYYLEASRRQWANRMDALRAIHPFRLTPQEAEEIENQAAAMFSEPGFEFNYKEDPDSRDLGEIIETRVDEDLLAEEAKKQAQVPYMDRVRDVFRRAFARERLTLEDTMPQRTLVAWRIVREWARLRGAVNDDTTLGDSLDDDWSVPETYKKIARAKPPATETFIAHCQRADDLDPKWHTWRMEREGATTLPGLAYMPPPVPLAFMERSPDGGMRVKADYNPREDLLLKHYIAVLVSLSNSLRIGQGSKEDPEYGTLGLTGLLRPDLVRLAMPSKRQIVTVEELLIQKTCNWMVHDSVTKCNQKLKDEYGLVPHECHQLIRMARSSLQAQMEGSIEEDRALMLMRLEDYIQRCKTAFDLNSELKALKQMSIVLGLAKVQTDDEMSDFIATVRNFSMKNKVEHSPLEIPSSSVRSLPG